MSDTVSGRAPSGQALVSDQAPSGLDPSGFDPSRDAEILAIIGAYRAIQALPFIARVRALEYIQRRIWDEADDAQGTPTRSAETEGLSPKDGGPVAESDAPNPTNPSSTNQEQGGE